MDKPTTEAWLKASYLHTMDTLHLENDWWPTSNSKNQALSTAWATAFFVEGAKASCSGELLVVRCPSGRDNYSKRILHSNWVSKSRQIESSQLMLDFSVVNMASSSPIQLTGESEMYVSHSTGSDPSVENDYAWDFFKLLIAPSSTRLFMARLAGRDGISAVQRIDDLANSLRRMIDLYGSAFIRPNDFLAAVILPAGVTMKNETTILWVTNGRVRIEKITSGLFANTCSDRAV